MAYSLRLPLSALAFYLFILLLMYVGFIPSLVEILSFLRGVYDNYGIMGLFIGSFLEGIVYLGLYFPGSLIIIVAAAFSNGTFLDFVLISGTVTLAISLASVINYYFGKYSILNRFLKPSKVNRKTRSFLNHNFFATFLHPNLLGFYVYTLGAKRDSPLILLLIPPIMFVWGIFLAWTFYTLREYIVNLAENPFAMITLLSLWFLIAFVLNRIGKMRRDNKTI